MKTFRAYIKPEELADVPGRPKNKQHWGYHLLIDASGCNKDIDNPIQVRSFFKKLVKKIDMIPIGDPIIIRVNNEEARGLTAVQIITTSTITFHGDDENWCVYLDVFACKPFDPKKVMKVFDKTFEPEHLGYKWIHRDAGGWPR